MPASTASVSIANELATPTFCLLTDESPDAKDSISALQTSLDIAQSLRRDAASSDNLYCCQIIGGSLLKVCTTSSSPLKAAYGAMLTFIRSSKSSDLGTRYAKLSKVATPNDPTQRCVSRGFVVDCFLEGVSRWNGHFDLKSPNYMFFQKLRSPRCINEGFFFGNLI